MLLLSAMSRIRRVSGTRPGSRLRIGAAVALLTVSAAPALGGGRAATERVSVDSAGGQADGDSFTPAISGNGRYVAFISSASNLVAGDSNSVPDVFVRDRRNGATERVSVDSAGGEANRESFLPAISASGSDVAFYSSASNLVAGDTNGVPDVFVRDRRTGVTERVSVDSARGQANGGNFAPMISASGRYVAFESDASNLVAGDTNLSDDVFVHDRRTGVTERVSVDSAGGQANAVSLSPAISADGRYVAFYSFASNLVAGDTNNEQDMFVHDRRTGATERVSVDSAGGQANDASFGPLAISANGRDVAFASTASNLVAGDTNNEPDMFVRDRRRGATERVSVDGTGGQADGGSFFPAISADGRYVAFYSFASNLVVGDTNETYDVFVRDRRRGATERVSVDGAGGQANGGSFFPAISASGQDVAFQSAASNLVAGDTNETTDVFVRQR